MQFKVGRHFIPYNFARSECFRFVCFAATWKIGKVVKINVFQCVLGLVADGQPICKNMILLTNGTLLVEPLKSLKCICGLYGTLEGRGFNHSSNRSDGMI